MSSDWINTFRRRPSCAPPRIEQTSTAIQIANTAANETRQTTFEIIA